MRRWQSWEGHVCGVKDFNTDSIGEVTEILKGKGDTSQVLLGKDTTAGGQRMDSRDTNWRPEGIWMVWGDGSYKRGW